MRTLTYRDKDGDHEISDPYALAVIDGFASARTLTYEANGRSLKIMDPIEIIDKLVELNEALREQLLAVNTKVQQLVTAYKMAIMENETIVANVNKLYATHVTNVIRNPETGAIESMIKIVPKGDH